jgi:mono/diheme cytochrome c family protein
MGNITINLRSRVALCALAVMLVGGCEREDWKPDVLAKHSVGHDETVLRLGRETYSAYCVGCHGENGDGNGPAARFLDPRPRDFTSGIIKFAAVEAGQLPHDADLYRAIKVGLNGTSMSGWEFMADRKIEAVSQYIKTFAAEAYASDEPHAAIAPTLDPWLDGDPEEAIETGGAIYHALARCSNCHPAYATKREIYDASKEMFGYGIASFRENFYEGVSTESDWGDEILAPDFLSATLKNGTDPDALYRVIVSGVGGTAMPTWRGALPEEQLWALVHYVKHLADMRGTPAADALRKRLAAQPANFVPPVEKPEDAEEQG